MSDLALATSSPAVFKSGQLKIKYLMPDNLDRLTTTWRRWFDDAPTTDDKRKVRAGTGSSVQDLLGHSSLLTTAQYLRLSGQDIESMIRGKGTLKTDCMTRESGKSYPTANRSGPSPFL
ncbi:MAG: hypothetical protein R6V55_11090 [Desulfovermiculus sp.]